MAAVSILSAMIMFTKSWHVLSNKTFTNCFKIAGILEKNVERVRDDEDAPFTGLINIKEVTLQTLGADLAVLKENLVIKWISISRLADLLTLTFKSLLVMEDYQIRKSLLISTMVKWKFPTTRMTSWRWTCHQTRNRRSKKIYSNSWEFYPFFKIWKSDDEILKRNKE